MTSSDYTLWLERHAERHGLTEALLKAATAWERDLSVYPRTLLDRASQRMLATAGTAKDKFGETGAERHYRLLLAAVASLEAEQAARERASFAEDRGTCARCGGSGAVSVPHWKTVGNRSEWGYPWYTCTVVCDCALGRWKDEHDVFAAPGRDGRTVRMMRLAEYEKRITEHWRELLIERDRELKDRAAAAPGRQADADLRLDGALAKLSGRLGF